VSDESISAARANARSNREEIGVVIVIGLQMLIGIFFVLGLIHLMRTRQYILLIALLIPALYILALSAGPEGAPRFRAQFQPFLLIVAAIGLVRDPTRLPCGEAERSPLRG
jgi:hypothetical protein